MAKIPDQRRPSRLRRFFKWLCLLVLIAVLSVVGAAIYLNKVGVPGLLRETLLSRLRAEGVQMDFDRMRLRWHRGVVVDRAIFTWLKSPLHPRFTALGTEFNLDFPSFFETGLQLKSVTVRQGNLVWPAAPAGQRNLVVSNITAHVQFHAGGQVGLTEFEAGFAHARIKLAGTVSNATAVRTWEFFRPKKEPEWQFGLHEFVLALEKIHLTGNPELTLHVSGDAAVPESLSGSLQFAAGQAETPWGSAGNLHVAAELHDLFNVAENNFVQVQADAVATRWGEVSNVNCVIKLVSSSSNSVAFQTAINLSAKQPRTEWLRAGRLQFSGVTSQSLTNLVPSSVRGKGVLAGAETKWGKAASAEITFNAATNRSPKNADASWAGWRQAEPFLVNWESLMSGVETPKLKVDKLFSSGSWRAPELVISNLDGRLYGGGIQATAQLNVATRETAVKSSSDYDLQKISPLLSLLGQRWISQFTWETPPKVQNDLHLVLPAWTNQSSNWAADVLPTLALNGHAVAGPGSFRGVTANSASVGFSYSNRVWTLPNFRVDRPEGSAEISLVARELTGEFQSTVQSQIDPKAIRDFLTTTQQAVFDDFQFTTPPKVRAEIQGNWNEMEKCFGTAEIAVSDFSYRSNTVDKLTASLQLTNQQLLVSGLHLDKADKFITAQTVGLDLPTMKVSFTNVSSTVDPYLVTRLIGEDVAANIAPYQFTDAPAIQLNGSLTIGDDLNADLHFLIKGTQFKWMYFVADSASGQVDWVGDKLQVTNVQADIYRGHVSGWGFFTFIPDNGADYRFEVAASEIDLRNAVKNLAGKTNHLEGLIQGRFALESGNTGDPKTLRGEGSVKLRDGLLWEVPIFGIFSPILNAIIPGAGNSRARQASATFVVRDGLAYSEDLEVRAATLRMQYRGAIDFQQNVDARVEAELLRDTWVIGRVISLMLTPISKLFEYKVTGTLSHPESEPVYIPNFLMMTLRPFHTLKKVLIPEKVESPATNSIIEAKP